MSEEKTMFLINNKYYNLLIYILGINYFFYFFE